MLKHITFTLFLILLISSAIASDDSKKSKTEYPTNLNLVENTINDIVIKTISQLFNNNEKIKNGSSSFYIISSIEHQANWLVENKITENIIKNGLTVKSNKNEIQNDDNSYTLSYRIAELNLNADRIWRSHLIGEKKLQRTAYAKIYFQLSDNKTNEIIWIGDFNSKNTDVIPVKYIVNLSNDKFDFTKLNIKDSRLKQIIEPVIVTGVVGGLIYLFYSTKSEK